MSKVFFASFLFTKKKCFLSNGVGFYAQLFRHSREGGNLLCRGAPTEKIPAFAGMTVVRSGAFMIVIEGLDLVVARFWIAAPLRGSQ